jgi:cytochrome P450
VGLPFDEWHRWAEPHHAVQYATPGSDESAQAARDLIWQRQQLCSEIAQRRVHPRDDMLTAVAQAEVDGRPITEDEGAALVQTVIGGGVDTTTATVANGLLHLYRHPEQRAWVLEDIDGRLPDACEELLRYYPPVLKVCRTATSDVEVAGQQLCPGERVALPVVSANRDEDAFERPDEVRLDRFPNRHVTFGLGIHRCVGSNAARAMLHSMIGEVLRRIPDYRILEDEAVPYGPNSVVDGFIRMPMEFTPGVAVGSGVSLP